MKHFDKREFLALLTVAELKSLCRNVDVVQYGNKADITQRIIDKLSDDFVEFLLNCDLEHYEILSDYWGIEYSDYKTASRSDLFYQILRHYNDEDKK